jgi:hypothetical protein
MKTRLLEGDRIVDASGVTRAKRGQGITEACTVTTQANAGALSGAPRTLAAVANGRRTKT